MEQLKKQSTVRCADLEDGSLGAHGRVWSRPSLQQRAGEGAIPGW